MNSAKEAGPTQTSTSRSGSSRPRTPLAAGEGKNAPRSRTVFLPEEPKRQEIQPASAAPSTQSHEEKASSWKSKTDHVVAGVEDRPRGPEERTTTSSTNVDLSLLSQQVQLTLQQIMAGGAAGAGDLSSSSGIRSSIQSSVEDDVEGILARWRVPKIFRGVDAAEDDPDVVEDSLFTRRESRIRELE